MITRFTHLSIWVLDQDSAYDFYVNKLGFKVVTDVPMVPANKGNRWLTVAPPQMENIEINQPFADHRRDVVYQRDRRNPAGPGQEGDFWRWRAHLRRYLCHL
jgi:catechol 2,3-dioxygenase-like lactoylglutathione lyase family enzyme